MKATKKELIGINTYLFSFPLICRETFRLEMEKMSHVWNVTEVFLNNELGFEVKLFKKI